MSTQERSRPPPLVHLLAGALGGATGSILTAPLDLVKTRGQSSLFQIKPSPAIIDSTKTARSTIHSASAIASTSREKLLPKAGMRVLLYNVVETGHILRDVYRYEGPAALFRGLGPTLVGVVPGRSINFFCYGNGKRILADRLNNGRENSFIHLSAAAVSGIITATATNPIWVVKTRLQLQHITPPLPSPSLSSIGSLRPPQSHSKSKPPLTPLFAHSFRSLSSFPLHPQSSRVTTSYGTALKIFKTEGIRGFYRGLSASLLGVTEGTIQWGLYEEFKRLARTGLREGEDGGWRVSAAAGGAKLVATGITYPHEVVRTRMRQPPSTPLAAPRYLHLSQTFKLIVLEEGWRALYGGMTPHLLRVVPNAVCMFWVYEKVLGKFKPEVSLVVEED